MSDASQSIEQANGRPLRDEERAVLDTMLSLDPNCPQRSMHSARVVDAEDGGMRGFRFVSSSDRHFGAILAEAESHDKDGVPVLVSLYADQYGDLLELDVWKADFTPLQHFPAPGELMLRRVALPAPQSRPA